MSWVESLRVPFTDAVSTTGAVPRTLSASWFGSESELTPLAALPSTVTTPPLTRRIWIVLSDLNTRS